MQLSDDLQIFQLQGHCFNATLTLQKFTQKCPLCQDATVTNHHKLMFNMSFLDRLSDPLIFGILLGIVILTIFAILLSITLIWVFTKKSVCNKYPVSEFIESLSVTKTLNKLSSENSHSSILELEVPRKSDAWTPQIPTEIYVKVVDENYEVL